MTNSSPRILGIGVGQDPVQVPSATCSLRSAPLKRQGQPPASSVPVRFVCRSMNLAPRQTLPHSSLLKSCAGPTESSSLRPDITAPCPGS